MKFIMVEKENETRGRVTLIHNFPDQLTKAEKDSGYIIEDFVEPENKEDKISIPYYLYNENKIIWEYKDRPISAEKQQMEFVLKELEKQKQLNAQLLLEMAELKGGK